MNQKGLSGFKTLLLSHIFSLSVSPKKKNSCEVANINKALQAHRHKWEMMQELLNKASG